MQKASKAKDLVDTMLEDDDAEKAVYIIEGRFPICKDAEGAMRQVVLADVLDALTTPRIDPVLNSIRDSFDALFYHYALFEHHIETELVTFEDVRFPADYYIQR